MALPKDMEFRAEHYERDLRTKKERGRGKAWLRNNGKELWADELEIDSETNKAIASGNVHIKDGATDAFCTRATYLLSGEEAVLEDATIIIGQMVITGTTIKKTGKDHYEISEGIYTNCNTIPVTDKTAGKCLFDWKVYGKHFDVTLDGYVYVYDAIIYSKDLPLAYIPFYAAPAKSKRQSGFLFAKIGGNSHTGTGFGLPYFWATSPWQDLTISPTYYGKSGTHLGLEYNYNYDNLKAGKFFLFLNERPFNADRNNPELTKPAPTNENKAFIQKDRMLGIFGEFAIDFKNIYTLQNGLVTRQTLTLLSDPFYKEAYPGDIGINRTNLGYLRSQATAAYPTENLLYYGGVIHHQSLIVPQDGPDANNPGLAADRGPATQLPKLGFSEKSRPLLGSVLRFEFDSSFNNFWRRNSGFDNNYVAPGTPASQPLDPNAPYQQGDFIRTGQRLQLEPKLIANVPIASGFQLQPVLKATESLYHFDIPSSSTAHREFISTEIPFSMYLSKHFQTDIENFEEMTHLVQPRIIYGSSVFRSKIPNQDFFRTTNPPFDSSDLVTNFEYFRIEFINRLRRKVGSDSQRFLNFQLSNQYNSRLDRTDPRFFDPSFKNRLGPLEVLLDLSLGPFAANLQGYYQWEEQRDGTGKNIHEYQWSPTVSYTLNATDALTMNGLVRKSADISQDEILFTSTLRKGLPIFMDLSASASYSAKRGEFRGYEWALHFASKPTSCWDLRVVYGLTNARVSYTNFVFQLRFGGPLGLNS